MNYYVYIITNRRQTTYYIGITNNLRRRIYEHKHELVKGFSQKYKLNRLIYFEEYSNPTSAIRREKQLKNWHRQWKINLIRQSNPDFKDISR